MEFAQFVLQNISTTDKHVWEFHHNPNKFWINLLSFKYLYGIFILEASNCSGSSCIWKAIIKTIKVLKYGFKTIIGIGKVILWYDKRLEDNCLYNYVSCVHISQTNLRMKNIYYHHQWNFSHLTIHIPFTIKLKI